VAGVGDIVEPLEECLQALQAAEVKLSGAGAAAENVRARSLGMDLAGPARQAGVVLDLIENAADQIGELVVDVGALLEQAEALRSGATEVSARPPGGHQPATEAAPKGAVTSRDLDSEPTLPTHSPNPGAVPEGEPERINPASAAVNQESLRLQNHSAVVLARAGYRVRQLPRIEGWVSPDYEIEGRRFDCYAPLQETDPGRMRNVLGKKIKKGEADRFVVNLDRSPWDADDLRRELARNRPSRLREVLVVKSDSVTSVWRVL
jgi:hypothetical protein